MSDIRPARRNEAGLLTDLAVRSKAHWRQARRLGYRRLRLTADPNAESFYLRRGARRVGDVASPIVAGRVLPLMEAGV